MQAPNSTAGYLIRCRRRDPALIVYCDRAGARPAGTSGTAFLEAGTPEHSPGTVSRDPKSRKLVFAIDHRTPLLRLSFSRDHFQLANETSFQDPETRRR